MDKVINTTLTINFIQVSLIDITFILKLLTKLICESITPNLDLVLD